MSGSASASLAKFKGLAVKFYELGLLDRDRSDDPAKAKAQDLELLKWQREGAADRKRIQNRKAAKAERPNRRSKVREACVSAMRRACKERTLDEFLQDGGSDEVKVSVIADGAKYKIEAGGNVLIRSYQRLRKWFGDARKAPNRKLK
jgi:hypothetical protein